MKQVIEYAARFPESLNPDDPDWGNKWQTRKRDTKEEAEQEAAYRLQRLPAA